MSDQKFDRLLSEIRNEKIDDRVVAAARERVRWVAADGREEERY